MILSRRGLIAGLGALVASPATVRAESLMRVVPVREEEFVCLGHFKSVLTTSLSKIAPGPVGIGQLLREGILRGMASGTLRSVKVLSATEIKTERLRGNDIEVLNHPQWDEIFDKPGKSIRITLPQDFGPVP